MMNIKPDRDYMTTILEKIKSGKIMIPKFQRDFVWTSGQILDLLDSILKGFPIGSLILWTPEQNKFKVLYDIEGVRIDTDSITSKVENVCYILDGRQRVTALLSSLFEEGKNSKCFFVCLKDLRVFRQLHVKKENLWNIALSEAFDTYSLVGYLERLKGSNLSDIEKSEYAKNAKYVNKMLQSYELGYINVSGGTIDDAVEIFSRLNSKATMISKDYLIQALAYDNDSDFLFGQTITNIKNGLAIYNFAGINRDMIFKCVYNYTKKIFFDGKIDDILELKVQLPVIMKELSDNITKAVEFLYLECGVIDSKLIPYSYHFIMLTDFFRIVPTPTKDQINELKKWFFYTTYTNYFTNTSLSRIRDDISRFRDFAKGERIQPIDNYDTISLSSIPEKYSLHTVRVCGLIAISILTANECKDYSSILETITVPVEGLENRNCSNTIICCSKADALELSKLFKGKIEWDDKFNRFCLSTDIMKAYSNKQFSIFIEERNKKLLEMEKSFLTSMGFKLVSEASQS